MRWRRGRLLAVDGKGAVGSNQGPIDEFDSKIKHEAGDVDHAIGTGHRQTHTFIVGVAASRLRRRQPCNEAMTVLTVACLALQATNTAGRSPQESDDRYLARTRFLHRL